MTSTSRFSAARAKLILLCVSPALSLFAAEMAFRLFLAPARYYVPKGMYRSDPDPIRRYRMSPNYVGVVHNSRFKFSVRTNALGFRGGEVDPKARHTIGAFGDSFTYGDGVEEADTYPSRLQEAVGGTAQVINAGISGYATAQEFHNYLETADAVPMETIVLEITDNDVEIQDAPPFSQGVIDGALYMDLPRGRVQRAGAWLIRHSELVARIRFETKWRNVPIQTTALSANFEQIAAREIESTEQVLGQWIQEAHRRHQRFVIFCAPERYQVEPGWDAQFSEWRKAGIVVDLDAAQRWLVTYLQRQPDVEYVDVVRVFRESYAHGGPPLYHINDGHWNATGNRLIAQTIYHALLDDRQH
jgi:lysophospholipase L1-like esterase